jgi:hypothetical protein
MNQLSQIKERLYNEILDLRSIHRLVTSKLFQTAWDSTPEDEHKTVSYHIDMGAIKFIREWIRKHNQNTLTIRELKEMAYQLGIYRYSRLSKIELLQAITEHENGRSKDIGPSDRDSSQSRSDEDSAGETLQI